jgi:hypothetical protein
MELILTSKDSEYVKSELMTKEGFAEHYMKFDYTPIPINGITN